MERTSTTILPTRQQNLLTSASGKRSDEVLRGLSPASHQRDLQDYHRSLVIQVSPALRPMNFGRTNPRHKRVVLLRKDFKLNLRQSLRSHVPPGASLVAHGHPSSTRPEHAIPHSHSTTSPSALNPSPQPLTFSSILHIGAIENNHPTHWPRRMCTRLQRGRHATSQRIQ